MAEAKEFAFDFSGLPDKPEGVEGKAFEFDFSALPDKPEDPNAPKIQQGKEEPWTKLFSGGYLVGPGNKITGGAPGQDMALVMGLSEQFDVTPSFAADHKAELSQLAIRREQPRATDVAMQSAVALGLITHPHATLLGVGAYMLVDLMEGLIGGAVRSKLTGGEFRAFNLSQLKPGDAPEWQKNTLEAIDFAHKAALAGGITKGAGPLWERFTKKTFESYGLPREVYISADKIKDIFQTGEKISGEEMDLVKGLGLTGEQYREAIRNGIDISIPTEKIVRVADKPWYAKLKQAIKITPYEEVLSSTPAGKPKARTHTERLGAPETAEKAAPELRGASKDSDGTIKQPVGYVLPKGRTIAEEARLVTAAMGQVESGNRAVVPGQVFPGGWIQGRFQYEPETWKQYSAEYNQALYQKAEPLPNTDTNQQLVTEWKVAQWLEQGYSPKQIAATWNSGSADWVGKVGVNDRNEPYNVPLHVDRFYQTYEKLQGKTPEPMTRDRFWSEVSKAKNIAPSEIDTLKAVLDSVGAAWMERESRPIEDFYAQVAGVQVGGKDVKGLAQYAGPNAKGWETAKGKFSSLYDKKPRFEIDDSMADFKGVTLDKDGRFSHYLPLAELYRHPELYQNYPELEKVSVNLVIDPEESPGGSFRPGKGDMLPQITVIAKDEVGAKETLTHEIQHWIQGKEGFAKGGDLETAGGVEGYRRLSGEIEARDAAMRSFLSPEERANLPPYSIENISPEDAITLYQRQGSKKGAVQFLEDGRVLFHLFEKADASTVIHEIGHWMRKRLLSPEELRVVEEDLGITSEIPGEGWSEKHEETYARSWERYWMEGKAPTYRLRAIFAKMRQYLLNIYQTLKNLKVELSDNLRAHFDRMIATEAERKERPIYELNEDYFVEPADHPLTVKEIDSYDKLASEAYRRARVNVEAQMKREDAKREAGWRKEALEILKDDPVHSGMDEIVKRGGLNEKQLRADYGDETIGSLKAARRGLVSPKGKLVPDEVAADFGFGDLDSMVQAFINSKTKPEAIESIVDSLRSEYAPTKEELAADMHLRLLDEEIKVLKEITESATAKMQNKTARGIKQVIRENTGQIKVDQVNDRGSYPELIAAMKREAAAARTAFNAGKKEAALKAKERQREISQKYRDMVKARNEFQKITKSLNRMLNDKKVNWEYKEALIELIQLTGRTKRQAKLKPGALQEFVDKQEVNGEAIIIDRDFIMRLQEMYYRGQRLGSMSMDDVRLLHDTAKQIHYAGKIHDQFIGEQRKISFQASKLRVIRSIYQNAKTVEVSSDRPLPPSSREKGVAQKFLDGIDAYHSELLMPEMILRALDGFHEMGPVYEEMWLECKAAADAEIRLQEKASKAIDETLALIEDRKAFSTEKHTVKGLPFPMTRLEMVGWYLHSLHPDNRAALAKGFGDPEKKEWLTEEQIDIPGNLLTEREKEIARKIVEELLPILTPHVEKTYLALNGRPMIRVKGVYYPLYFDRKLSDRINEAKTEREAEQAFKDFFPFIGTKFGSTIERKGGKYPPELNFIKVLSQYFNEGTHFATHAVAVRNLLKIINDPDFKRAVTIARGENAYKQLKPWLKEIANPGREPMLKGEALVGYIRRNTTAFIMVGRLSTALIQPTAILSAIPEVGAGWVLKGVSAYLSNPWKWDKFIEERSASIANRSHSYDREMADVGNGDSWKDLYLRWGMYMTAYLDTRTARMAWLSAYTKAMNGRVENIAQGDEGRAIDYADGVTERSQGSASPKNKAAIMRGGELFKTFITFFYTFFNAQYNQIIQAWGKYKSPTLDYGILDLMKDYWFLLTIPGIINELTRGNTPKTPGDIALYPFTSTGKMLLSTIPLVRDASSVFFEGYDYRGGMLGNVGKEIKSLGNAMDMSKTKRDRLKQILIHGAKATGNLTGLPPDQLFIFLDELTRKRRPTESTKPQNFIWRERKRK